MPVPPMKRALLLGLLTLPILPSEAPSQGQPAPEPSPSLPLGKLAPRPLFRDPPFDAPTDPVLCFHAEAHPLLT